MCEICDNFEDKKEKGKVQVNKNFILHEESIGIFHSRYRVTIIEKSEFHIYRVIILGAHEFDKKIKMYL